MQRAIMSLSPTVSIDRTQAQASDIKDRKATIKINHFFLWGTIPPSPGILRFALLLGWNT